MKKSGLFFLMTAGILVAGCLSNPQLPTVSGESNSSLIGFYQLRSMDSLHISLLGIPEEKQFDTVINENGEITIPYINEPVKARGLTTSELERKIQQLYMEGKIYRNITVNVQTSAQSYYMEGEIARPQEYPLNRRITLLQAIAAAGGYNDFANPKNIIITRNGNVIKVNAKDIERHPERDIPIEAGDRIKVNRSIL
jgi:polysaccharide export outer membrane protein